MTREELIKNLKYTMKKHENDKVNTFGTNISLICKDVLDYLEQELKWIPVEHELPEKGKQVLCCNKHGSVFTSAITYIEKYKDGNKYVCFGQHHDVIAWMPLPEPYKTGSKDKK